MKKSEKIETEPKFKIGDKVEPIDNIDSEGKEIMRYDNEYVITSIKKNIATLCSIKDEKFYFFGYFNLKNIKKVGK